MSETNHFPPPAPDSNDTCPRASGRPLSRSLSTLRLDRAPIGPLPATTPTAARPHKTPGGPRTQWRERDRRERKDPTALARADRWETRKTEAIGYGCAEANCKPAGNAKHTGASREEMSAAKLPIPYRDSCAHLLIPLNRCRYEEYYLPWKCEVRESLPVHTHPFG